ncbi:hypothetical protein EDD66_11639 [Mobilisporobacter senegalensis]|uniref:Uncharacterized protein n=1 Tax=Mobilisporobacter senegalensis TaxID=1329262 RepID=A0A3N1XBP3_9FIRM|nr:hypothetical protein [Mobilisporobacter senegalensis]ROR22157.1 hypothetical protein EDD66_11639 [Mobilisporobacter senegalensis]
MEKVISLLSEIEEKAAKIIESTSIEKEHLHNQLEKDMKQLDEKIMNDNNKKLEEIKYKINLSLEEERKNLADDCNHQISKLESKFSNNHNELIDEIFHKIIGV